MRIPQRKHSLGRLRPSVIALLLASAALVAVAVHAQNDVQAAGDEESQLISIRLAARGGDYDLAQQRLSGLTKPVLVAKGTAALAAEHARDGELDEAAELFDEAIRLAEQADVRTGDRVSVFLYSAKLMHELEGFDDDAQDMLVRASEMTGKLAGIQLNMSLIELAEASLSVNGDLQETEAILSLISDPALQAKMLALYGFPETQGEE